MEPAASVRKTTLTGSLVKPCPTAAPTKVGPPPIRPRAARNAQLGRAVSASASAARAAPTWWAAVASTWLSRRNRATRAWCAPRCPRRAAIPLGRVLALVAFAVLRWTPRCARCPQRRIDRLLPGVGAGEVGVVVSQDQVQRAPSFAQHSAGRLLLAGPARAGQLPCRTG